MLTSLRSIQRSMSVSPAWRVSPVNPELNDVLLVSKFPSRALPPIPTVGLVNVRPGTLVTVAARIEEMVGEVPTA